MTTRMNRRSTLAVAGASLATLVASRTGPTEAAANDPLVIGKLNLGSGKQTRLRSNVGGGRATLQIQNLHPRATGLGLDVFAAGTAIRASGPLGATAIQLTSRGRAIDADGNVAFSLAGSLRFAAGQSKRHLQVQSNAAFAEGSYALATLQGDAGDGVAVRYAKLGPGGIEIEIALTAAAAKAVTVAWWVFVPTWSELIEA